MRLSLLQQQQQRPAMGQRGRLARSLYSMTTRQLAAAQVLPYGSGSRAARNAAAAAGEGRPSVGAATPVLQDAFSSRYSFSRSYSLNSSSGSSSSKVHSMRLAGYDGSDAPMQPLPDAYSSTGAAAGPPAEVPAAAYDGADVAAVPTSADVQQATNQALTASLQSGLLPQGQSSGMLPAQRRQAPIQPGAGQSRQMQAEPQQGAWVQQGRMQPGQVQPGQVQPRQTTGMQQQPLSQQAAPGTPLTVQQPMQGQPQSMPMQAMQGQLPAYTPAAQVQPGYVQQPYTATQMGQGPAPAVQAAAMGQMPAAGQAYMQAAPAAATAVAESDFAEEWVNCVGLTGVVLHGPFLQQFGSTGSIKASLVLGLLARATGEAAADAPRPVLVEAWGERAQALVQQVQTGALVFLQGHLALDLRPQERSPSHGPALTVKVDSWDLVTASTVPPGRALCTYKGEYDGVLTMIRGGGGGGAAAPGASAQSSYGVQQAQGYQKPNIRKERAMQMFLQGTSIFDIAKSLGGRAGDVFPVLVDAAEAQGAGSPAWAPLLGFAKLSPPAKAVAYYNAVQQAVQLNREPLTKDGHVRMKPVREFLLSPQCQLAQEVRQQEAAAKYGVNTTYDQVRLLLAMLRANVRL